MPCGILTAETVIGALEDAEDYAAFEMAITADFEAETAVGRELVLRLASLLWRLRRATAIESGLFKIQARQLLQFRQRRQARDDRQRTIQVSYQNAIAPDDGAELEEPSNLEIVGASVAADRDTDDLTRSFLRLTNLPTYPLDRLSRYEATIWRQASQILFALHFLERGTPYARLGGRLRR
jgi:hypothetical protein